MGIKPAAMNYRFDIHGFFNNAINNTIISTEGFTLTVFAQTTDGIRHKGNQTESFFKFGEEFFGVEINPVNS